MEQQLSFGIVSSWAMLWITTVVVFVFVHFFIIEVLRNRPVYWHWAIIRVCFALLYGTPLYFLSFWECAPLTAFQLFSHFVIYNPLLNILRQIKFEQAYTKQELVYVAKRYPFWYLGEDSGVLDKWLGRLGPVFYQSFYFASLALMIISLIVIYVRYVG